MWVLQGCCRNMHRGEGSPANQLRFGQPYSEQYGMLLWSSMWRNPLVKVEQLWMAKVLAQISLTTSERCQTDHETVVAPSP